MNNKLIRVFLFTPCLAIVFGCSPYVYKNEITVFGESVEQSLNAMEMEIETVTKQDQKKAIDGYYEQKAKLQYTVGCVELLHAEKYAEAKELSAECQVAFKAPNSPPASLEPPALNKFRKVKSGLKNYIKGLEAITNAKDKDGLTEASKELTTSLIGLQAKLAQLDEETKKKVESTGTVIGEFITAAATMGLDNARYKVLKEQVNIAHPRIEIAGEWLEENAAWYHVSLTTENFDRGRNIAKAANKKIANISAKDYEKKVISLQEHRDKFVALSLTSSATAMEKMINTHAALKNALNDKGNDAQSKAVFENLKQLYEAAQKLTDAVDKSGTEQADR